MGACESKQGSSTVVVDEVTAERVSKSSADPGGLELVDAPDAQGRKELADAPSGRVSIQEASDERASFVRFIKHAAEDENSPEFADLRHFLTRCFVDCDTDFDGLIGPVDFDKLVERAGALPRKWGFAPTTAEMFSTDEARMAFRKKTFKEIDTSGVGTFALDEWLSWALSHVRVKSKYINYATAETKMSTSKSDFKEFIVAAVKSRHCPEYKELYHFLQDCFMKADTDNTGFIDAKKFDTMVELAAEAPRKFGYAPPSSETYASDEARLQARTAMFKEIVAKNKRGMSDRISLNAWLLWAYQHICAKAKTLDPTLSGEPPAMDDLTHASYGGAKARSKLGAHRGISAELASNNKEMFIKFIKAAAESKKSPEYEELHYFLMECFVECDLDFDGLIHPADFDNLVERAGALPRKWGFAPTTVEMFKTVQQKQDFRQKIFKEINTSGNGTIHFDEWLNWSYQHICKKASTLSLADAQSKMEKSAPDFKAWIIAAAKSRESSEYKELYHFLHECFMRADVKQTGLIDAEEFDKMVELAAAAPRRFGYAPPTSKTYKSNEDRIKARTEMFNQIASRNRRSFRDKIPFQSWLAWAYAHICAKAKELDPSLSGFPPGEQGDEHQAFVAPTNSKDQGKAKGKTR